MAYLLTFSLILASIVVGAFAKLLMMAFENKRSSLVIISFSFILVFGLSACSQNDGLDKENQQEVANEQSDDISNGNEKTDQGEAETDYNNSDQSEDNDQSTGEQSDKTDDESEDHHNNEQSNNRTADDTERKSDDSKIGAPQNTPDDAEKVTIDRVVDGDTVRVHYEGSSESVRLLLVDTPETVHPDKPEQPYGEEASNFAKETFDEGDTVYIEFDGPKRGKYDRLLGYIWHDGKNFNKQLLKKGLARYAYVYDPPYTHQEAFEKAEQKARENERGIWSIDGYVTSDGFNPDAAD